LELKENEIIKSKTEIRNSKTIIFDLLKGRHIYQGANFSELKGNQGFYESVFNLMELELVCHQREFFYLVNDSTNLGKNSTSIALIFFVLMRTLSVVENDPRPNLFRPIGFEESIIRLDNLASNDRAILEESGIISSTEMDKKLQMMERLGFISRIQDEKRFVFNPPAHRLIELCESYLIDDEEHTGDEEE